MPNTQKPSQNANKQQDQQQNQKRDRDMNQKPGQADRSSEDRNKQDRF